MTVPDIYSDDSDEGFTPAPNEVSKRSRGVAIGLCIFGGAFGLHRFYTGKTGTGIAMLCTFGGLGVWWLYDLVLIAAGEFRDIDDLPLRNWNVGEPRQPQLSGPAERRVEQLEDQIDAMQRQFDDLAERVDFAERMLAQKREPPPQLSRG